MVLRKGKEHEGSRKQGRGSKNTRFKETLKHCQERTHFAVEGETEEKKNGGREAERGRRTRSREEGEKTSCIICYYVASRMTDGTGGNDCCGRFVSPIFLGARAIARTQTTCRAFVNFTVAFSSTSRVCLSLCTSTPQPYNVQLLLRAAGNLEHDQKKPRLFVVYVISMSPFRPKSSSS